MKRYELSEEEQKLMVSFRDRRDKEALRLGVLDLEFEQYRDSIRARIRKIAEEEKLVAGRLAREKGIDPMKGKFWFEHETGELVWEE